MLKESELLSDSLMQIDGKRVDQTCYKSFFVFFTLLDNVLNVCFFFCKCALCSKVSILKDCLLIIISLSQTSFTCYYYSQFGEVD